MGDGDGWRTFPAHQSGQRPSVDAADADPPGRRHPGGEILLAAEIGGRRHGFANEAAQRMRLARLDVLLIGADIADVGEGERDDLPCVGGIGHHLLVTGHSGVEAELADRLPFGAESPSPRDPPIGENDDSRCSLRLMSGRGMCIGHRREVPSVLSLRRFR